MKIKDIKVQEKVLISRLTSAFYGELKARKIRASAKGKSHFTESHKDRQKQQPHGRDGNCLYVYYIVFYLF